MRLPDNDSRKSVCRSGDFRSIVSRFPNPGAVAGSTYCLFEVGRLRKLRYYSGYLRNGSAEFCRACGLYCEVSACSANASFN